jgi:exonuclease VII small subunit
MLHGLGEDESSTTRLEEAVAAYRDALKEWTRESAPLQWAMAQMNLGNALAWLGDGESGTARLEEAVAAYRDALKKWTREHTPLQWAETRQNLAVVETLLSERRRS